MVIDYALKGNIHVTFEVVNETGGDTVYCKFKIDQETTGTIPIFTGAVVDLFDVARVADVTAEVIAMYMRVDSSYSSNLSGSCVFRFLPTHTQSGTTESST